MSFLSNQWPVLCINLRKRGWSPQPIILHFMLSQCSCHFPGQWRHGTSLTSYNRLKVLKRFCHAVLLNWAVLNLHIGLEANSSWLRLHFGNMPFYLFFTFLCFFHMAYLTNSSIKMEKFCHSWAQRKKEGKAQLSLFPQHFQNLFSSLSYHLSQMTPEGLPTVSSYNKTHANSWKPEWSINEQQRGTAKLPKKLNKSTML